MRPVGDPWQGRREFAAGWGPEDPGRGPNNHLRWPLARAPSYARWVGARGPWVWTREPPSVAPGKGTVDLLPLADFRTQRLKIGEVGKRISRFVCVCVRVRVRVRVRVHVCVRVRVCL